MPVRYSPNHGHSSMTGLGLLSALLLSSSAGVLAQQDYEPAPVFLASDVLPSAIVKGPHHQVDERVTNDGLMNRYVINSRFGSLNAASTAELEKRVSEFAAIESLEKLSGTEEFMKNMGKSVENVVEGAAELISNPVDTVSGALSGVGKLLDRAGEGLFGGDKRSQAEDSELEDLIGFSSTKREYAKQFNVDPYSANPILQKHLNDVAWAGYSGGISTSAALAAVSGGAGIALSVSSSADMLNRVDVSRPPFELRKENRAKLDAMGVNADVIDLFMANGVYTPVGQSLLVQALDDMTGVEDRGGFVKIAVRTKTREIADFRQRQARMFAAYHQRVSPFKRLLHDGHVIAAETTDGKIVAAVPTDYVTWSKAIARATAAVEQIPGLEDRARQIWLTGGISATAKQVLEARGWQVEQDAGQRLLAAQ